MGRDNCTTVTRLAKEGGSRDSSSRGSIEVQPSKQRYLLFRISCKQQIFSNKKSYLFSMSMRYMIVNVLPRVMLPFFRLVPVPHAEEATNAAHVHFDNVPPEGEASRSWTVLSEIQIGQPRSCQIFIPDMFGVTWLQRLTTMKPSWKITLLEIRSSVLKPGIDARKYWNERTNSPPGPNVTNGAGREEVNDESLGSGPQASIRSTNRNEATAWPILFTTLSSTVREIELSCPHRQLRAISFT